MKIKLLACVLAIFSIAPIVKADDVMNCYLKPWSQPSIFSQASTFASQLIANAISNDFLRVGIKIVPMTAEYHENVVQSGLGGEVMSRNPFIQLFTTENQKLNISLSSLALVGVPAGGLNCNAAIQNQSISGLRVTDAAGNLVLTTSIRETLTQSLFSFSGIPDPGTKPPPRFW